MFDGWYMNVQSESYIQTCYVLNVESQTECPTSFNKIKKTDFTDNLCPADITRAYVIIRHVCVCVQTALKIRRNTTPEKCLKADVRCANAAKMAGKPDVRECRTVVNLIW